MKLITKIIGLTLVSILIFPSCQKNKIAPKIEVYLNQALDSIKKNALNSSSVNWEQEEIEVFKKAKFAKTTTETYEALIYALEQLDDNHSFLQKGGENLSYPNNKNERPPSPYNKRKRVIQGGTHGKRTELVLPGFLFLLADIVKIMLKHYMIK